MNDKAYRKSFKDFFKSEGFSFTYHILTYGMYTIEW